MLKSVSRVSESPRTFKFFIWFNVFGILFNLQFSTLSVFNFSNRYIESGISVISVPQSIKYCKDLISKIHSGKNFSGKFKTEIFLSFLRLPISVGISKSSK